MRRHARPERHPHFRLSALALGSLVGVAACQWLVTLKADAPALTAAANDAGPPDPCGPIPPRPAPVASPVDADAAPNITLAAYYWGYDNGGQSFVCASSALDLDGLDSGAPDCTPAACAAPGGGGATNKAACDGPYGADNALASILSQLSVALTNSSATFDALSPTIALQRGVLNLLFDVRGYNGLPDDDAVDVAVWTSSGITGLQQPAAGFAYQDIQSLPTVWDGGQDVEWTVDERSATGDGDWVVLPKVLAHGYVKGEILVVPTTGPMNLPPLIGTSVAITDGILTGHLFRKDGRWQLTDGRIAAKIESARLLGVVGTSKLSGPTALCDPANDLYPAIRQSLCASLDLPPDGGPPDAATTCGALSLGFALASVESKITYKQGPGTLRAVATGKSHLQGTPLCVDDAGTVFCDDCAWPAPRRCAAPAN